MRLRLPSAPYQYSGFTLIELSIVLVVIGLIVGGVLVGRDLIEAAKLRDGVSQIEKYKAAALAFKLKYNGMPGDIAHAGKFWPLQGNCTSWPPSTPPGVNETCAGNGDGYIGIEPNCSTNCSGPSSHAKVGEISRFYQHLSLSGMIKEMFGGGRGYLLSIDPDYEATWPLRPDHTIMRVMVVDYTHQPGDSGNALTIGSQSADGYPYQPGLTPYQAMYIDTKLDDGQTHSGKIGSNHWRGPFTGGNSETAAGCWDSGDENYDASNDSDILCAITFENWLP